MDKLRSKACAIRDAAHEIVCECDRAQIILDVGIAETTKVAQAIMAKMEEKITKVSADLAELVTANRDKVIPPPTVAIAEPVEEEPIEEPKEG